MKSKRTFYCREEKLLEMGGATPLCFEINVRRLRRAYERKPMIAGSYGNKRRFLPAKPAWNLHIKPTAVVKNKK